MKRKVYVLSCTSTKEENGTTAQDLYSGPLFTKALAYAQRHHADDIIIIGGKNKSDVFRLDDVVSYYDGLQINKIPKADRLKLAQKRLANILAKGYSAEEDTFVFLTGKSYYEFILDGRPDALPNALKHYELPFVENHLRGIGYIEQFLNNN